MSTLVGVMALLALVPSTGASGRHMVIVHRDGTCETARLEGARPEGLDAAAQIWAWSANAAPRLVKPAEWSAQGPADSQKLLVRVLRREGEKPRVVTLTAAPVPMWEAVPEPLLPRWDVPLAGKLAIPCRAGVRWRVRLSGTDEGTWWVDVPPGRSTVTLAPQPAMDRSIALRTSAGQPVSEGSVYLLPDNQGRAGGKVHLAILTPDQQGTIRLPGLPDSHPLVVVAMGKDLAPRAVRGSPGTLPATVRLGPGVELRGRVAESDGRPISAARVSVEFWAAGDVPWLIARSAETDSEGVWRIAGVSAGDVSVRVENAKHAPYQTRVQPREGVLDLGVVTLAAGVVLPVVVVDDLGAPVSSASVTTSAGVRATTDARGIAGLSGVVPDEPFTIAVKAEGTLPSEVRVTPPLPADVHVELVRAFTVIGRFLDGEGLPVLDGDIQVEVGSSSRDGSFLDGGRFRAELPAATRAVLVLRSKATVEARVAVAVGAPGEVRDLGDVKAAPGLTVVGKTVSSLDGSPLAGVRVWTPRSGARGSVVAWMLNDLVETTSGGDGSFRLAGLAHGAVAVRFEAPGLARAERKVTVEDGGNLVDVGEVALEEGATVRVATEPAQEEDAIVRIDLRGDWLDADMLTAPLRDGRATVPHVPSGNFTVSVLRGQALLCEEKVDVPGSGREVEVVCRCGSLKVNGMVLIGEQPSGEGSLTWAAPTGVQPAGIMTQKSGGGLRQTAVFWGGRPQVTVPVGSDGSFESDALRSGSWAVTFIPIEGASPTPPVRVELPSAKRFSVTLRFSALVVRGVVTDSQDEPLAGARVRELESGALAFSAADGAFSLSGLGPGVHSVQARLADRASDVVRVELEPDRETSSVHLVVDEENTVVLEVKVAGSERSSAGGALVFLELEGQGVRTLTADAEAIARATLFKPFPARVRAAALVGEQWVFGRWEDWKEARDGVVLTGEATGTLVIESEKASGSPEIVTAGGWNLSWLLLRLGIRPVVSPDAPFTVAGLPAGDYLVTLGELRGAIVLRQRRTETVKLR